MNDGANPIISISKSDASNLIIRAFNDLIPVIPNRFEEYNKHIGLQISYSNLTHFSERNITNDELISLFNLKLDFRYSIINESINNLEKDSTYPPDYYAITLVQSFCAILVHDIKSLDFDYIQNFLKGFSLGWSCLPLYQDLCANIFMIFYTRFLINSPEKDYMLKHLSQIDKIGSEFSHCFLQYSSCFICSCNYLFDLIFQTDDQIVIKSNFNSQVPMLNDHFAFILKSINWKITEATNYIHTFYQNIIRVLPIVKKENISIVFQFLSFIAFTMHLANDSMENQIRLDTKEAFSSISELIDRFIKESEEETNIFPIKDSSTHNDSSSIKMKELKYFDFISDESSTFSKDCKLSDYDFDTMLFNSLFDGKETTVGIIAEYFNNITNLYSLPKASIYILVEICKPKIESGNLNYQAIFQLYISKEVKNLEKLCTYFESYHLLNTIFFNQYLFDCSISLFDYKNNEKPDNKVLMRINLFNIIYKLVTSKQNSTEILNSIIFLLNYYIGSCQMFTEIIFLLKKFQFFNLFHEDSQVAIIELLSSEISVQQQWQFIDSQKAQIIRPLFLALIGEISFKYNYNDAMHRSKNFINSFFSLLFEPEIFKDFFELFCKLSIPYIQSSENELFAYFQSAIQSTLKSILSNFNQNQGEVDLSDQKMIQKQLRTILVYHNFGLVLKFLINDGTSIFISLFVKFQLFELFTNIITSLPIVTPSSDPSLVSAMKDLISLIIDIFEKFAFSPVVKKGIVHYNVLIKPIQALTITEKLYKKLRLQVCYPHIQFRSIERPEVLTLLILSTENSDYFPQLLTEVSIMCRDSIWNCFAVFNSGILIKLLEKINMNDDKSFVYTTSDQKSFDILDIILNLFCLINIFVSSRQLLYAFTRLFHVFDDVTLGNLANKTMQKTLTPHLESYMNSFRTVFTIRSHIPSSFIHFSSSGDFVEMKSPLMKELMNGFTVSIWLLLDSFDDENEAFSVLYFKGKNTSLNVYLAKNKLCMIFMNGNEIVFKEEVDILFPSLEWFNLTLNYDRENGLSAFVNGRKKNSISKPLNFLSEDFQTLKIHSEPDRSVKWMDHGQLSLFAIFIGNNNSAKLAKDIHSFGSENVYSILSIPNITALYSAFKAKGDILINCKEGSTFISTIGNAFIQNIGTPFISNIGNAKFKGSVINSVASFCQVFESSNGAAFITALWSLINLKYADGKEEKRLISWLSQVMETVCQYSEISQVQLLQINATQVISYFIGTLPDERITCELWSCFNRLFKNATNKKFKSSLCTDILFNYHMWIRASCSEAVKIYSEWRYFIQTVPFEYCENVSIQSMIDLLKFYFLHPNHQENDISIVICSICLCMYDISLQKFTFEDAEAALNLCIMINDMSTVLSILKLFENVFYNKADENPFLFFDILLKRTPFFFTEASEPAKEEILLLFQIIYEHEKCNISILIDFIYCVIYQNQSRSKNALFLMKNYMAKSIGTNSSDFEKTSNYQITSVVDLFLSIFSAIFVDSTDRMRLMTPFLGKISAFPENQIKVTHELNKYSLLILTFYGIVVDNSVIPFISAFLFRDIKKLYLSFLIIDSLERFVNFDFINQLDIFINHCVSLVIANPTIPNRHFYFELFMSRILYHRKINDFSWLDRNKKNSSNKVVPIQFFDFLNVAETRKLNTKLNDEQINSPSYIFGCIIQNNQWNELTLAKSIFQLLIILANEDAAAINPSLVSSFIFSLTNKNIDINPLLPQLSQLITILGANFISEPFLLNMSLRKSNNQTNEFLKKHFKHSSVQPNIGLYSKTTEVFEESLNIIKRLIIIDNENNNETCFNSSIMTFVIDFFTRLAVTLKFSKKKLNLSSSLIYSKKVNSNKPWRRLVHKLRNERSPLLTGSLMNTTRHYKRRSYFDHRFRPILLTPNEKFDIHAKASELALQQAQQQQKFQEILQNKNENEIDLEMANSIYLSKRLKERMKLDDSFYIDESLTKWNAPCLKINVLKKKSGTFSVFSKGYIFTDEYGKVNILKAESVLYIFWRWNLLIPNSVEIFMDTHKSFFFSFVEEVDHSFVSNKLLKISLPNKIFVQTKPSSIEVQNLHLTEKWLDYSMSTFDYLMALNMFSGRSFLNLSCYPVFPWILVDYASPSINIHSKPIYRDFKIPIGALNRQELEKKKEKLKIEIQLDDEGINRSSFLYQTGYSNQFIVTYYMLRLEPFTTHHISLMDGRFDNPNRLFNSISDSFMRLITTNSAFRELIPEFFFQPEFLLNSDKFSFGVTLREKIVDDVEIPPWGKNPVDFVHKHLLALESDECGAEISNWIDLIWGCKQSGQGAVESDNTFDPHMYVNNTFDPSDIRTDNVRELIGQIPIQLFEFEHPKRGPRPVKNLPATIPKKIMLNPNDISNFYSSSSFVVTCLNYKCSSFEHLKIYSLHKNGKLFVTKFKDHKTNACSCVSSCLLDEPLIPTDPRFIATCDNSTFVCSLNDGRSLLVFQPSVMKAGKKLLCEEKPHIAAISCIGASANYVITGGCDASVVLWNWSKKNVNVVAQSVINNDTITAVAVSNEYGIAVSCARDGIMTLFRLPRLDFVRNMNLNQHENTNRKFAANRVIITKGMGYIIVFLKNENEETNEKLTLIRSYSLNGLCIGSLKLECKVIDAISVTNKNMIDYLLVLIEKQVSQEILLVDAHSLEISSTISTNLNSDEKNSGNELVNQPKVTKFSYHEDAGIIILAFDNSEFVFIPFILN